MMRKIDHRPKLSLVFALVRIALLVTLKRKTSSEMNIKKLLTAFFSAVMLAVASVSAAPYAAIVINAETGEVLHEENANTRLHPAGLTKLMTLYVLFDALETGLIGLDDEVLVSNKAASESPVKLGLEAHSKIKVRYLLRASAVNGANDASTALGEGLDGSEAAFARRMNGYSKELGLSRSTWKNAHGLTEKGHLSTARDMATLFAAHMNEYPNYFNLFSRIRTHAGIRDVASSSRRMLGSIKGIQGAKYGYTRAAGFNGATYVTRGNKKVVAVIFGGRSTATMIKRMHQIIDIGLANYN